MRRAADRPPHEIHHAIDQHRRGDGLHIEILPPGESEHALGEGSAAFGALHGVVEKRDQIGIVGQAFSQDFEASHDRHQQIVEVVGDAAGQLADRFHLLRLEKLLAGLRQGLLGLQLFGDVAGDLGETQDRTVIAVDGVDDDMCPEPCAVLALSPAFLFEAAFASGGIEADLRFAALPILFGIELREVLADDLVGGISLDALGASIPIADIALRIEHVERVVRDALHEQLKLLLAALEAFFGRLSLRQVAGDFGEADQTADTIPDRVDDDMRPKTGAVLAHAPAFHLRSAFARGRSDCALGRRARRSSLV